MIAGLDIVMDLANFTADMPQLARVLGWQVNSSAPSGKDRLDTSKHRHRHAGLKGVLPAELYEFINALNGFDRTLYRMASLTARTLRKVAAVWENQS